ncbi:MAG: pyroglutamyl-peptidase I [Actinomycetota bacterium]
MSTRVLITGFEPFGNSKLNPSALLVERLGKERIPGVELHSIVLPVEFDRSVRILLQKIEECRPDFVISFGQAEGRTGITPEKVAINFDDARIPDNSGDQRKNKKIDENGPDAYFSTLPVERMVEAIKSEGIVSALSLSAGAFVCNHLFYEVQRALQGSAIKSGFIHLPLIPEQSDEFPGQPTLDLSLMVRGAKAAILSAL